MFQTNVNIETPQNIEICCIRNVWLCRVVEDSIRPQFCDLHLAGGRISEIRPADYRRYLQGRAPDGAAGPDHGSFAGSAVGPEAAAGQTDCGAVIDAAARVATVPAVNFHEHLYSRLAKGLTLPGPMDSFRSLLANLWWRLDEALDEPMVEACAYLGAAQSLHRGVTYVFDHHSSPAFVRGSLDTLARILGTAGLRSVLCLETSDRHEETITRACLEEQRRFLQRSCNADLHGLVGLHAPFTLSDATLQHAASLCRERSAGIHIHLAEDRYEQTYSRETFGCSATERLQRFGLLERPGIVAHGVHLQEEEWRILAGARCALAVNPDSNLNNAVGLGRYARIPDSLPIVAGTDGMHASPSRSLKQVFLLHRHRGGSVSESFALVRRIYSDQLSFVRTFFPDYPYLNPGDRADLVIWDYRPASPFRSETFWGHLIYGILEAPAWTVCMRGRALLAAGVLRSFDSESAARLAAVQGERLFCQLGVIDDG